MMEDVPAGLAPGTVLGAFVIVRHRDAGGMGDVYEARDTRLDRVVALKVIRHDVASDPARRQRLEREARSAAMLNHPHIVTVHSLDEHQGVLFLTMELIEGSTLRDSIPDRGFPLNRMLQLAAQAADALAAAHAAGVIHRDLKPANMMITKEGALKVLDFGLSTSEVEPADPSLTTDTLSGDGRLHGTAPYMAPEVIEGGRADARSDIFALGIVLFEMATGRRPFESPTPFGVISAILRDRPPLASDINPEVPGEIARLIDRCLAKVPAARRQSAADLRADLEELERRSAVGELTAASTSRLGVAGDGTVRSRRGWVTATAFAILALVASAAAVREYGSPGSAPAGDSRLVRFTLDVPPKTVMPAGFNSNVGISRDGRTVAYTPLGGPIQVRRLDDPDPHPLEGSKTPGFERAPLFSPDGKFLFFIEGDAIYSAKRQLQRAALSGGAATALYDFDMFHAGDWASDGWIYWTAQYPGGIVRIRDTGGPVEPVTTLDLRKEERSHRFAHLLPGGEALIYTVGFGGINSYDDARIELFDLRTKEKKTLLTGGTSAVYSPSGHLVYARGGKLLAAPFDLQRREVTGGSFEVLSGVMMSTNTGSADFALSDRGDLAYVRGGVEGGRRTLVWVDRNGKEEPLPLPPASYLYPRLSPDGHSVAVEVEGPNHDFSVYDFDRSVMSKMTTDGESHDPVWSPDGRQLAYRSWIAGGMTMWLMPVDRSSKPVRLNPRGTRESPASFSPDGRYLSFDAKDPDTNDDARALPIAPEGVPVQIAQTRFGEGSPKFSPDGHWVAYTSDESGKPEVYVQAFPGPGPKVQVSSAGGADPVWRRRGGELYYRSSTDMMVVTYTASDLFHPSAPKPLWKDIYSAGGGASCGMPGVTSANYDVTPDGSRFLMVKDPNEGFGTKVMVVLNWAEQLKELSRARGQDARATAR